MAAMSSSGSCVSLSCVRVSCGSSELWGWLKTTRAAKSDADVWLKLEFEETYFKGADQSCSVNAIKECPTQSVLPESGPANTLVAYTREKHKWGPGSLTRIDRPIGVVVYVVAPTTWLEAFAILMAKAKARRAVRKRQGGAKGGSLCDHPNPTPNSSMWRC